MSWTNVFNEAKFRETLLPSSGHSDDERNLYQNVVSLNIFVLDKFAKSRGLRAICAGVIYVPSCLRADVPKACQRANVPKACQYFNLSYQRFKKRANFSKKSENGSKMIFRYLVVKT